MDVGCGMDYWIFIKITEVEPRVIVDKILPEMATQAIALVRPYKLDYTSTLRADRGMTILPAAAWVASNGYRLIGCDSDGGHAFLSLEAVGEAAFPSIEARSCSAKVRERQRCCVPSCSHTFSCADLYRLSQGYHVC